MDIIKYDVQVEFYLDRDRGKDERFSGAECSTWEEVEELILMQDTKQLIVEKRLNNGFEYTVTITI